MYFPVASAGYILLGSDVPANILLYAGGSLSIPLKVAVILEVIHLVVTYMIASNTVALTFEDILNVPHRKNLYFRSNYFDFSYLFSK